MKKMFLNFAEQMLSKDQMKKVKGGCGGGSCTVRCYDAGDKLLGEIDCASSCTGGNLDCKAKYSDFDNATCTCS